MSHQLLLATRNKGKIEEFRRILDAIAPGEIELIGLESFPDLHDVVEDGSTFQENAIKKAREMSIASGIPAIADDSGLCVDFLNGDPGIFSARWAGAHGDDQANLEKVGEQGFGYDPIFQPEGYSISSAQMSAEEKDSISHRGKSLRAIAPHVITLLNTLG